MLNKINDSDWLKSHEIHEANPLSHTGSLYHKCIYIYACTKINLLIDVKCLQMSLNINLMATQALYRFIILVTDDQLTTKAKNKTVQLMKVNLLTNNFEQAFLPFEISQIKRFILIKMICKMS